MLLPEEGWIVHVPSTLPDEEHPIWGNFMEAHIHSVASYVPSQIVYHAYPLEASTLHNLSRHEGILTETNHHKKAYWKIIRRYRRRSGWQALAFTEFILWAWTHRKKIRLLHAHGTVWGGIWCALAGRLLGIPVIVSEHTSDFPLRTMPWMLRTLTRASLPLVQALLPVTADLGDHIRPYAPHVPQFVIPNCVNTAIFKATPLPPAGTLRILFVGAFVPVKRIELAIRACARLQIHRQLKLRLGGIGPLLEPMRDLAASLGLSERVEFLGLLSNEQVRQEMANCHFLLLTSSWETQSRVAIEAMLSGRPVVAPSVGGLPETVADGECGILFKASEEASVVDAMETVASKLHCYDPETIAAHCRFRFSYESVGKSLASLYESFAQN